MRRFARWVVGVAATLSLVNHAPATEPSTARLQLRLDPHFVLAQVAQRMGVTLRPEIAPPTVFLESVTPVAQFRDTIAEQWGFRPHVFGNAYAVERNEVYLIDDPAYYARLGRTIDESLAHELAHYVQVKYLSADLAAPAWEQDAIAVQAWFRDLHIRAQATELGRRAGAKAAGGG
jgi:hypothetical protein